ncbi:hypothetical protein DFR29_104225 [Tahibacter aquaticus]|uniref:Uncharacterized protein n=1 Tax=Tahibacter aquaticus TaxID=520092 RepID=A0A4R6Z2H0_9GAMM|nr:hypothetical protein [Tahibacter aquaticus]TDR45795.1 hypothetical protein DFR29_104225 [Tahibacter aquaticus]
MRIDKNLVVIGLSDEDTAHLRLLIRKAAEQLQQRWRWGSEEGADLVIVDADVFAGQMARTRALAAGMRVAVLTDESGPSTTELRLNRPLKLANVIDVLNQSGGGLALAPAMGNISDDMYLEFAHASSSRLDPPDGLRHLFDEEGDVDAQALGLAADEPVAIGADELFKRDEGAHKPRFSVPLTLDDDTYVERGGATSRSESRVSDSAEGMARQPSAPGPNTLPPVKRGSNVNLDGSRHALRAYLQGQLLAGPAQIRLGDAPALTLDPKNEQFYTEGGLGQLEIYARAPLSRSDWRALTTAELAQVRDTQTAQPYQNLVWLEALVQSGGRLAAQLDPGGSYKLKRWLELDRDVRQHQRIARAMLQPARLNEISAAANVPMADVFDVVNAYYAIGLVEWETRASLRAPAKPEASGGLLSRLKRPFGRS